MSQLEEQIRDDVFEFQVENGLEIKQIEDMSLEEVLDQFLSWNGILGYTSLIMKVIELKGGKNNG